MGQWCGGWEMNPDDSQTAALVCVAHFINEEEAQAFAQVAEEGGVEARVGDARRVSSGFDGTLGGADSLLGYSVYVARDQVAALREYLKGTMEVDPLDPLCSAGRRELTELATGPLQGNLCEQIIAGLILAGRPEAEIPQEVETPEAKGRYLRERDLSLARWLGCMGLALLPLPIFAIMTQIAQPVLSLLPMIIGGSLIFSRRQLPNGTTRPQFPRYWQRIGHLLLGLPILILVISLIQLVMKESRGF